LKYEWQRVEERWRRKMRQMKVKPTIQFPTVTQSLKLRARQEKLVGKADAKRLLDAMRRTMR